ncbi:43kDa postsynaptic protein [Parasponia andersonii]|uniref:RING-type E3 ubiquitin transferase n=1 Tax=Parasponia andersonii TaxID=3476 RepID=A0A2P5C8E8_PARAD|nr:43kDa postsynaptic protein [Parasponia andersonii]
MSSVTTPVIPYICEVWQPEINSTLTTSNDDNIWSTLPEFLIDVFVTYTNDVVRHNSSQHTTSYSSRYFRFTSQRHHFLESSISWSIISNMLSHMLVPLHVQPLMIQKISTSAREIASQPENLGCKTIPLVVALVIEREPPEEEEVEGEADELEVSNAVAAALEKVRFEGFGENNCVICLEEMLGGCEAVRLPCLHFYHEECILNWLKKSSICPLCRLTMP